MSDIQLSTISIYPSDNSLKKVEAATDDNLTDVADVFSISANTKVIRHFTQRNQELTDAVRRMSNGSLVDETVLSEYSHELSNYHAASLQNLSSHFHTSLTNGLTHSQADTLLQKHGMNALPKSKERPLWLTFLLCFTMGFSPLLWIAFVFVFITYIPFGTPPSNIYNLALAIALIIVVVLSGLFTFYQEVSSSIALSSFANLLPPNCIAIRDGKSQTVSALSLVIGDIIILESGLRVPSDVRIISATDLKIDKSMLTGENEPVKLHSEAVSSTIPMLQAHNIAFMGCNIVEGQGIGLVIATGKKNQLSKIAEQVGQVQTILTSLQIELNYFVVFIAVIATITSVTCILEWHWYLDSQHHGFMNLNSMICNAISVLVAFVPEGFPLALQTGLTIIANRLCKTHQVLIKQLSIIETVGSMTLLASDKTGTLTQNKMTVSSVITSDSTLPCEDSKHFHPDFMMAAMIVSVQCNQSKLQEGKSSKQGRIPLGSNGIDKALLAWVDSLNMVDDIKKSSFVSLLVPFSSTTKITIAIVKRNDTVEVMMKGAPEYILERCEAYTDEITNEIKKLTPSITAKILSNITDVASTGKRVIGLATLVLPSSSFGPNFTYTNNPTPNFPTNGLTFLACVAVSDPPREGVSDAITTLREAGISVAMVTGDAVNTAVAIAKQVGIISESDSSTNLSIHEIDNLHDFQQLELSESMNKTSDLESNITTEVKTMDGILSNPATLMKTSAIVIDGRDLEMVTPLGWSYIFSHKEFVFARATPDQKLRIVIESQKRGHRVGVTGDGVNDSPALKRADVGIAMGLSGSDVAKDAANIILLNDDFSAVTKAVLEGRLIFINLRKVIAYQLSAGSWSELIPVLATFFIGMPQPLSSFLMIIICCATDVLAGITLMNEPPESSLMKDKPRDLKTSRLVTWRLFFYSYLWYGTLESIGSFINYFSYMSNRGDTRALPNPIPSDDDGTRTAPFGYRPDQLIFAWNWLTDANKDSTLYTDQTNAANVASSVFFVTLVVSQMGHLLTVRRKTPYLSEIYENGQLSFGSIYTAITSLKPIPRILLAWIGAVLIANMFNEIPAIQVACGTGSVPARNWGIAIGWSALIFFIDQCRKWIVIVYPNSCVGRLSWETE